MKKLLKRSISMLLVLMMVIGLMPTSMMSKVSAASDVGTAGMTIYVDASTQLSGGYYWDSGTTISATISQNDGGTQSVVLTAVEGKDHWYYFTLSEDSWQIYLCRTQYTENNATIRVDARSEFADNVLQITGWQAVKWTGETYTGSSDDPVTSTEELQMIDATLYDYMTDSEVSNGWLNISDANANTDWHPFGNFNTRIQTLANANSDWTFPLYFGNFNNSLDGTYIRFYHKTNNSSGLSNMYTSVQGLVKDTLDSDGNLMVTDTLKAPYFDSEWLSNNYGVTKKTQFPMRKTTKNGITYYEFDSNDGTDNVWSNNYNANPLVLNYGAGSAYSVNDNWPMGDSSKSRKPGFFPFSKYTDNGRNTRNFGFGAKFEVNFTIPENGLKNGVPVTFDFTGDDDLWVFVDGKLVLDMGGDHKMAEGYIDFNAEKAYVTTNTYDVSNVTNANDGTKHDSQTSYDFSALFDNTDTSKVHTLTVFYMERGMIESNLKFGFSFEPLPTGLSVSKEVNVENVNAGLQEVVKVMDTFDFNMKTSSSENGTYSDVTDISYTKDWDGEKTESVTMSDGNILGLADNIYARDFVKSDGSSAFTSGTWFSIQETVDTSKYTTTWKAYNLENASTPVASGSDTTAKFQFGGVLEEGEFKSVNYNVNFINTPKVGSVEFTKQWGTGTAPTGTKFNFLVEVDLDGDGTEYAYETYDLEYSIKNNAYVATDGVFTAAVGEEVVFPCIPVGAKVRVTETVTSGDSWEIADASKATVETDEIKVSTCYEISITNKSKTFEIDKVIYVEANKENGTDYEVKDDDDTIKVETATPVAGTPEDEITVTVDSETGKVNVDPTEPNETYKIEYTGDKNGAEVTGTITVHTYAISDDLYVFDYGLKSDLADTTDGNGMFQNDSLYIKDVETTAKFTALDASELKQSTITADKLPYALEQVSDGSAGATLSGDNQVIFEPSDFMDKQETATYGVTVYAPGNNTGVVTSPEDGVVLENANVKVMPANVVYYEDNFDGIEYDSNVGVIVGSGETDSMQSNANDTTHGNDIVYNDTNNDSDGTVTELERTEDGIPRFSFTFSGTGFDIVGRTTTDSGILTIVVENAEGQLVKSGVVDTYYANGDLYQIPVISIRDLEYAKYTVRVALVTSTNGGSTFYLDGIRIYNPLGEDTSAYPSEEEQSVAFANVHDLLVGDGEISEDRYDTSTIIGVTAEKSKAVLVYYEDGVAVLYGDTNTENQGTDGSWYSASLVDYLEKGPNNEVYLDPDKGIAFDVQGDVKTIQVEAKQIDITTESTPETDGECSLAIMDADGELTSVAKVKSKTAMYYSIPLDSCIKLDDGSYRVILIAQDTVSISNIKYTKDCTITLPETTTYLTMPVVDSTDNDYAAKVEKVVFSPSASALKASKKVIITVTLDTEENFDSFYVYFVPDTEIIEDYINDDDNEPITITRDSKSEKLKYTFYAPEKKGKYNFVIIPVDEEGNLSCYQKSVAVTVK